MKEQHLTNTVLLSHILQLQMLTVIHIIHFHQILIFGPLISFLSTLHILDKMFLYAEYLHYQ